MIDDDAVTSFAAFRGRVETATLALMNGGDTAPWEALWSHADDVTLFGGWGGRERGWAELSARWKMVAGRYSSATMQIERIAEHVSGDMAVAVHIQHGDAVFSNGAAGRIGLRVTHVCRREAGEWRLVHRHADEQMTLGPIEAHIIRD